MSRFLLPCLMFAFPFLASAGLQWESTYFDHHADPSELRTEAIFHFTNTGSETVLINNVSASCGCTTPSLDKSSYAPGESGVIRAVFEHADRVGRQHKRVTVDTSAGFYYLDLNVVIPELIRGIQPRILEWKVNEEPATKTVRLSLDTHYPIEVARVLNRSRMEAFEVLETRKVAEGEYEIDVRPVSTETPSTGSMQVITNFPEENPRRTQFIVRVR